MTRSAPLHLFVALLAALGTAACGGDTRSLDGGPPDASQPSADASLADTGPGAADAGPAGDSGPPGALSSECTGACAETTLTATFGEVTEPFDRAQFGITRRGDGSIVELHVEAHGGGSPECPSEQSPSPDRTLIVVLPVPTDREPFEPRAVTLLDFGGSLSEQPFDRSLSRTLTPTAARIEEGGFFAFDLEATFEGGTASGHLYATHCASLDALE